MVSSLPDQRFKATNVFEGSIVLNSDKIRHAYKNYSLQFVKLHIYNTAGIVATYNAFRKLNVLGQGQGLTDTGLLAKETFASFQFTFI